MPTANLSDGADLLRVAGSPAAIELAAPSLARHLRISEAAAMALLRKGELQLAAGADPLVSLLRALGIVVQTASGAGLTVSLYSAAPDQRLQAALAALGLQADAVMQAGGLVLAGQTVAQIEVLRRMFRQFAGLQLTVSDPAQARFDLFARQPLTRYRRTVLETHVAQLGLPACICSGALATGLTRAQVQQVQAGFADCGLLALDQAFQRFDLYLTGISIPLRAAADFLAMRTDLTGVKLESVTPLAPLRLESALNRSAARAFCADYASIGLRAAAQLCGLK